MSHSISWRTGALSPNTIIIPPEGIFSETKRHKSCITPGLSYVLPPPVKSASAIGHHLLHDVIPRCDGSRDVSGKKCLKMFDLDFAQAVQARTPTSHGMAGFHKEYQMAKKSKRLWGNLASRFNISKGAT